MIQTPGKKQITLHLPRCQLCINIFTRNRFLTKWTFGWYVPITNVPCSSMSMHATKNRPMKLFIATCIVKSMAASQNCINIILIANLAQKIIMEQTSYIIVITMSLKINRQFLTIYEILSLGWVLFNTISIIAAVSITSDIQVNWIIC